MSASAVLAIAIPIIVIIAVVGVIAAVRRRDTHEATGNLSRETRRRDKSDSPLLPDPPHEPSGREVEAAAAAARQGGGTAVMLAEAAPPAPYVPLDPETVAVTRRQFFNRGIVALMILALSGFGASILAFLWPKLSGGFGSKISLGKLEDVNAAIEELAVDFEVVPFLADVEPGATVFDSPERVLTGQSGVRKAAEHGREDVLAEVVEGF